MAGKKISAVLITKDEEDNIPRALRSVSFADEIIVLDTGSTDRTVEICRAGGARVEVAEWYGYVAAKNAVADLAGGDWLLSIDADEEVTPELREEIERVVADPRDKTGFFFPRRNHYLGRWVRRCGWYPDYQLDGSACTPISAPTTNSTPGSGRAFSACCFQLRGNSSGCSYFEAACSTALPDWLFQEWVPTTLFSRS